MCVINMVGRVARFIPEGFESTGTTLVIGILNVGFIGGDVIAGKEISWFRVKPGYLERIYMPMALNTLYSILLILLLPVFIRFKLKRNTLEQIDIASIHKDPFFDDTVTPRGTDDDALRN